MFLSGVKKLFMTPNALTNVQRIEPHYKVASQYYTVCAAFIPY